MSCADNHGTMTLLKSKSTNGANASGKSTIVKVLVVCIKIVGISVNDKDL